VFCEHPYCQHIAMGLCCFHENGFIISMLNTVGCPLELAGVCLFFFFAPKIFSLPSLKLLCYRCSGLAKVNFSSCDFPMRAKWCLWCQSNGRTSESSRWRMGLLCPLCPLERSDEEDNRTLALPGMQQEPIGWAFLDRRQA
jgi:hypothetical protein